MDPKGREALGYGSLCRGIRATGSVDEDAQRLMRYGDQEPQAVRVSAFETQLAEDCFWNTDQAVQKIALRFLG